MKTITSVAILLLCIFINTTVHGDEINPGIAYKCNTAEKIFALEAVMETDTGKGAEPMQSGFTMLLKSKNVLSCKIGKTRVVTKIRIYPGSETGMCGALGSIHLESLKINGKEILEHDELFNNAACSFSDSDPNPISIEIKDVNGQAILKVCKGKWDEGSGFYDIQCTKKTANQ